MSNYHLKIKQIRAALGWSQRKLAKELDVSPQTIYRYESNKSEPDKDILEKLVLRLDININWYFADKGKMFITKKH